jgi:hypothetical protein
MRDEGWTDFLNKVGLICSANDIPMPNMGDEFKPWCRLRGKEVITMMNQEHYHVDFFDIVINIHLKELNMGFGEKKLSSISSFIMPKSTGLFPSF